MLGFKAVGPSIYSVSCGILKIHSLLVIRKRKLANLPPGGHCMSSYLIFISFYHEEFSVQFLVIMRNKEKHGFKWSNHFHCFNNMYVLHSASVKTPVLSNRKKNLCLNNSSCVYDAELTFLLICGTEYTNLMWIPTLFSSKL